MGARVAYDLVEGAIPVMKEVYRSIRVHPALLNPLRGEEGRYGWFHFVERSGEAGRSWAAAFGRREHRAILLAAAGSLSLLHRRDFAAGRALLLQVEEGLRLLEATPASVRLALETIHRPLRAYYHYALGELDAAEEQLDRAVAAMAGAIGEERLLLPLAQHSSEFHLHRARIARRRRCREGMLRYIEETREMMEGHRPLCVLADGTAVTLESLRAFHAAIPDLTESEQTFLRPFFDRDLRMRLFERFVGRICPPGV